MAARGIRRFRLLPPPDGFFPAEYQITVGGRLAVLFATIDIRSALESRLPFEPFPARVEGLVAVAHGSSWQPIARTRLEDYCYAFDVVGERICVLARRAHAIAGARLFHDGVEVGTASLGSGIEFLQCGVDGSIWTGYSDVGMDHNSKLPGMGWHGIIRFSPDGERIAAYAGSDIVHCYALNVGSATTWAAWHPGFPIVELTTDFKERRWLRTQWRGGFSALAVSFPHVLAAGGFAEDAETLTLLRLAGDERAKLLGTFDAREVLGIDSLAAAHVVGRGDVLHVIDHQEWISVPAAVLNSESLKPRRRP